MKNLIYTLSILALFASSCQKDEDNAPEKIPEFAYAGGETTIFDATSNAFSSPAPNLSQENFDRHMDGDLTFDQTFVTEPAAQNPGLGPLFNNNSCVSCHIRNGRSLPALNGDALSGFLIRISVPGTDAVGGPKAVPYFGGQLQNRAIFGQEREANFSANELEQIVTFLDGTERRLTKPDYQITAPYHDLPSDVMLSPRTAPAVFGLGLLEAIPESRILTLADENDGNGDGISGKANMVWNVQQQAIALGRFGWKAEMPTILQQTASAYHEDMGVTNSLFPSESCLGQPNCNGSDGQVDIRDEVLELTTFYTQTLAVPAMRHYNDPQVLRGKQLFEKLNCGSCHVPSHTTGAATIPELANQTIFPYTDMLLHDMGDGLADMRPSFKASGKEWRTPPLWGLGLMPVVNGHSRLLHDGRARNIEEAILWHGGEADNSKQAYMKLSLEERNALLAFLNAL
jgi:CxxC motif-containing protein (DUF1111 family)